jgi:serine/threonine-protein kinase
VTRYELLDRIGVGGMAEIFRGKAVAAGGFEKPVAIKRILPHLSQDKRFVELLIAEAKVLSLLKHRNIVQIFDVGLGDDGKYFLVMEYVDGKDLGAIQLAMETRRKRLPFDLALHIGAEICEALEHAHTARAPDGKPMNLVHRDVSPSNVLLSLSGEVKLTDFGIAKRAEQETQAGAVRGKFAYISPEQARNEAITPRSDVFSVGILLWEMVTNRRLFSGLGDLEALRAVREAKVPRPTEIDPRLDPQIDGLLLAALSPEMGKRPTAGQLGAKLRSLRYSMEVTVGDPATELAKIIDTADQVQRESKQMMAQHVGPSGGFDTFEGTEATVIRIRTADAFAMPDKQVGMAKAREVIDRFEEEETKLAQLSGEQMRILRGGRRDSDQIAPAPRAPGLPGMTAPRSRRQTDEPTTAHTPLDFGVPNRPGPFDADESTKLRVGSRDPRTPMPQMVPARDPGGTPMPGTVHGRSGPPSVSNTRPPAFPPPVMPQSPPVPQMPSPQPMPPPPQPGGFYPHQSYPPQPGYPQQPPPNAYFGVQGQLPPRGASPTAQDMFERPVLPRTAPPPVAGFGKPKVQLLKPWMLIVGALVMAALAFAITRVLLS